MNKFTDKVETVKVKKEVKEVKKEKREIIEKHGKKFVVCPKCGWVHTLETKKCRFCGSEL